MNIKEKVYNFYLRLKKQQGDPKYLAQGAAMGAAIGITPTLPFHTIMVLSTSVVFRLNPVVAMVAATIVSNPFTFVPQYYAAWWIGDKILPGRLSWEKIALLIQQLQAEGLGESLHTLCEVGFNTILVMTVGGIVLAVPTGIIFYIAAFKFFMTIHKKRRNKHLLNN